MTFELTEPPRASQAATSNRGSCLTCRKRRLRCSRNKPTCERCWNDNKQCIYAQFLRWEEDSSLLGIAHGRGRGAIRSTQKKSWTILAIERKRFHFLNFGIGDIKKTRFSFSAGLPPNGFLPPQAIPFSPFPIPGCWPNFCDDIYTYCWLFQFLFCVGLQSLVASLILESMLDCEQVARSMVLMDDSSNAFRQVVLPLAFNNPIVLSMVFALGALSLAYAGHNVFHAIALRYKLYSLRLLRYSISHSRLAVSDPNLIAILMLSVFEASTNEDITWSIHLCAAVDMLKASAQKDVLIFSTEVSDFVSRFFIAKEALGGTACGKRGKVKNFPIVRTTQIDPYLGCSLDLIDTISQITELSVEFAKFSSLPNFQDKRISILKCKSKAGQPEDITRSYQSWCENADSLGCYLERLTQRIWPKTFIMQIDWPNEKEDPKEEIGTSNAAWKVPYQTSLLMHVAAKLYFLACLRLMSPVDPKARSLVQEAVALLKPISPHLVHPIHLWPIFVCAVHAVDDADRVFFLDQFDALRDHCHINLMAEPLRRTRIIVESVWKGRDIHQYRGFRGEWVDIVQPMIHGLCFR